VVDFFADVVFLLVQRILFLLGDVAAILAGHVALFLADLMILPMKIPGLPMRDLAVLGLFVDAAVLIVQPVIHLGAARMTFLCLRLCERIADTGNGEERGEG
jgi:hypothetical protein